MHGSTSFLQLFPLEHPALSSPSDTPTPSFILAIATGSSESATSSPVAGSPAGGAFSPVALSPAISLVTGSLAGGAISPVAGPQASHSPPTSSTTTTLNLSPSSTPSNSLSTENSSLPSLPTSTGAFKSTSPNVQAGLLAGIVVAVTILVLSLVATAVWRIRRSRREHGGGELSVSNRTATEISPFTLITRGTNHNTGGARAALDADSDLRSVSASTPARQRLETQLRAATEKIGVLEAQARREARGGSGIRQIWRSVRSFQTTSAPGVEAQLREQIELLNARINALETNSEYVRGMDIGTEPPPDYASQIVSPSSQE